MQILINFNERVSANGWQSGFIMRVYKNDIRVTRGQESMNHLRPEGTQSIKEV